MTLLYMQAWSRFAAGDARAQAAVWLGM